MAEYSPYFWTRNQTGFLVSNQSAITDHVSEISINLNGTLTKHTPGAEHKYNWAVLLLTPIVVFGMTGNILVCMAVSMEKRLQTVTNYFLLSLAITDLLVCFIVMPLSIVSDFFGKYILALYFVCLFLEMLWVKKCRNLSGGIFSLSQ